jgi:hypothetical protein
LPILKNCEKLFQILPLKTLFSHDCYSFVQ